MDIIHYRLHSTYFPPGPTVTYLITTSMTHGKKTAYEIVWGSFWGVLVCLILSFIGIGAILKTSGTLYAILRLLGIAYLIYVGIKSFLDANKVKDKTEKMVPPEKGEAFKNGFLLIFLNPKILFSLLHFYLNSLITTLRFYYKLQY